MANSKISALAAATTPLAGTEVLPIVQSSATTNVTVANLTAGRAVSALSVTTTSDSTINSVTVGRGAGAVSTNTVFGSGALTTNSTGSGNTVIGYQALYSNVITNNNTAVGYLAGYSAVGIGTVASDNTFIGARAGTSVTTARKNTFIGNTIVGAGGCGSSVTTGNANVIIGAYTGLAAPISQTGSNYIVLSDGDGNIRYYNDATNTYIPTGNIVPQTAARGINFTANTPATGMTSQLLNWYEEGTWTPNQGAGLTLVGAFSSTGRYTRIGRQVSISGTVTGATSVALAAAGVITSNLPFTVVTAGHGDATNAAITASAAVICTSTSVTAAGAIAATATITFSATYFV